MIISFAFALLGYANSLQERQIRPWHMNSVPMGMLFVAAGMFFALKYKEDGYRGIIEKVSWKWIIGLFAIGYLAQRVNGKVSFGGNNYKQIDLTLIAAFSLIFAVVFLCMKLPQKENRSICSGLIFAGKNSLALLGIHKTILFAYIVDRWFPFYIGKKGNRLNQAGAILLGILTISTYYWLCL